MGFQAVIKSAASAASLGPKNPENMRKTRAKHAKHAQNTTKSLKSGFEPEVKSFKMGLSINPRQFLQRPTLFAIFGPARGQIFGKKAEKIANKRWIFAFFCFLYRDHQTKQGTMYAKRQPGVSGVQIPLLPQHSLLYRISYIKGPKKLIFPSFFHDFFGIFLVRGEAALAADLITA